MINALRQARTEPSRGMMVVMDSQSHQKTRTIPNLTAQGTGFPMGTFDGLERLDNSGILATPANVNPEKLGRCKIGSTYLSLP